MTPSQRAWALIVVAILGITKSLWRFGGGQSRTPTPRKDNQASYYNERGLSLGEKGDIEGALVAFKKAVELDPGFSDAYSNIGNMLRTKGDLRGAIKACEEAIRLNPNLPMGYNNLANAVSDMGDEKRASSLYRKAIELTPADSTTEANYGRCLRRMGDLDRCCQSLPAGHRTRSIICRCVRRSRTGSARERRC